ncbi:uncharacterized protein isoform X3 [Rhodnius prolixus]|uniref:uncharacterized protein isoform X3 n=1 Tax=Rhodnius prolixus TaxID=13249 RepID=UPI003D18F1CE
MRPRPLSRNQPAKPGKIDKKQRLAKKNSVLKTDESVLKQSVKTCVNGLDKVIKVLENGTEEVVDFLSNECSIIYECRVCSSLFRSLANFISHKRVYCRKKVADHEKASDGQIEETMLSVSADFQKGILSTRSTSKRDIVNFLDTLQINKVTTKETAPDLFAVELEATKEALFHCFRHEGKHCSEERSATLGPDGKIIGSPRRLANGAANFDEEDVNKEEIMPSSSTNVNSEDSSSFLPCPHCPRKFPSDRTLQSHTKSSHNMIYRTYYSCPCCKKYLANTWSVYRHLSKVHKKSNEQIRRLRSQIHKKQTTDDDSKNAKPQVQNVASTQEEIKPVGPEKVPSVGGSGESHRCYICGKWFERRVVMLSHAQICRDKNSGLPCVSSAPDPLKMSDGIEMLSNKRPRTDSPSPPPVPKSGIEVRMYYEKNKSSCLNTSSPTTPTTPPDTMHLKPKALALLASLPRARVVLTKTPVPVAVASRVSMTTPSPPPSDSTTSGREFSPRAEDVISRYRGRQNFTSQIFERRDSLSPSCKVAVESVACSDTEDSNSGCECVLGAREIENCIGTVSSLQLSNRSLPADLEGGAGRRNLTCAGSFAETGFIRKIKEEPTSDEEEYQLECRSEELECRNEVLETVKQEIDSCVEEEEEEEDEEEEEEEDEEEEGEEEDDDGEEIDEGNMEEEREEDDSRFGNGQEQSSLTDLESISEIDDNTEVRSAIENLEQDEEDDDYDEYEDGDEEEEEETEDDDENSFENNHKVITREDSLIKEQVLNGLLKNGARHPLKNGISSKYAVSWIYRKINSYIDGPKKKCLLCLKTFHRLNLVRRHVASHLNIFNFKCTIDKCDFKCFLRTDMVKHLLKVHKKKEVRRNRSAYMKRISNDMIPIDHNGVPCVSFLPMFPSNKNSITSVNKLDRPFGNVPKHEKLLPDQVQPHSLTRISSVVEDSDSNRISNSIDLQVESGERTLSSRMEDEDSTVSSSENLKEFHTTNMQMSRNRHHLLCEMGRYSFHIKNYIFKKIIHMNCLFIFFLEAIFY